MTEELKAKLGLDTTDLKAGLVNANREIRVIESGFRASAAALGDWTKSATGLEGRIQSLTGEIGIQQAKVGALADQYAAVAAEKGATSRAAQDLQIKLNQETERLNKMQTELTGTEESLKKMGDGGKDAGGKLDELGNGERRAADEGKNLEKVMGGLGSALKVGAAAIAAVGAAASAAAKALADIVLNAADAAGELVDTANKTGLTTNQLQVLSYVGDQVGVSTETITGGFAKLTRSMDAARAGTKDQEEAFSALGVSVVDANGNLRDSEAVFQDTLAALGGVSSEADRDALALRIFGRSAQELNPLIKTSASEMEILKRQAFEMGAVVSEDNVGALEGFGDELASMKASLQGSAMTMAASFMPALGGLVEGAKGYLADLSGVVRGSDGDLAAMAQGVGDLLGKVASDIATQAPKLLGAGLSIVQGILNAILQALPALIPAAVNIVTSLVQFLVQNLPLIIDAGIQMILALVTGILPMLPMLIEAALQIIITLAQGITQALPTLIPAIVAIIPQIVLTLIENLPLLIEAALQLILALATGLIQAIPILLPYIPAIVQAIFDAIIIALPMIGEAAVELMLTLIEGIGTMLPLLGESAGRLVQTLVDGVKALWGTLLQVGSNIVQGVWEGIRAMGDWFFAQVKRFFANLIKAVKVSLKIQSPSLVFAEIGEYMALGLGQGFAEAIGGVQNDIVGIMAGMSGMAVNANLAGGNLAAGQIGGNAAQIQVTVYATLANRLDEYELGRTIAEEIRRSR